MKRTTTHQCASIAAAIMGAPSTAIRYGSRHSTSTMYDLPCNDTYRVHMANGHTLEVSDRYCGCGIEGECYRAHVQFDDNGDSLMRVDRCHTAVMRRIDALLVWASTHARDASEAEYYEALE